MYMGCPPGPKTLTSTAFSSIQSTHGSMLGRDGGNLARVRFPPPP
jgi:hypothetical protein